MLTLTASDISGQKRVKVQQVSPDLTVGELVTGLVERLRLPRNGQKGQPLSYHALLERERRHLHSTARIGTEAQDQDVLILEHSIDAG